MYLNPLFTASSATSQGFFIWKRYPAVFFTRRIPSSSERSPSKISGWSFCDTARSIEPDFAVMECIHHFCSHNSDDNRCKVHHELLQIQKCVEAMLKEKTLYNILEEE